MEKPGGLSPVLKQRITGSKVAVIGSMAVEPIAESISRLGFDDIVVVPGCSVLPICDVAICTSVKKEDCREVLAHLLVAMIAGNNVKTYPKFYLSTIANDVN